MKKHPGFAPFGFSARSGQVQLGVWAAEGIEAKRAKTEDRVVLPTSPGRALRAQESVPRETGLSRVAAGAPSAAHTPRLGKRHYGTGTTRTAGV